MTNRIFYLYVIDAVARTPRRNLEPVPNQLLIQLLIKIFMLYNIGRSLLDPILQDQFSIIFEQKTLTKEGQSPYHGIRRIIFLTL